MFRQTFTQVPSCDDDNGETQLDCHVSDLAEFSCPITQNKQNDDDYSFYPSDEGEFTNLKRDHENVDYYGSDSDSEYERLQQNWLLNKKQKKKKKKQKVSKSKYKAKKTNTNSGIVLDMTTPQCDQSEPWITHTPSSKECDDWKDVKTFTSEEAFTRWRDTEAGCLLKDTGRSKSKGPDGKPEWIKYKCDSCVDNCSVQMKREQLVSNCQVYYCHYNY